MATYMMKTWVMVFMALCFLGVSLGLSLLWQDPGWFGRAGSLVAVLGLILMLKRNLLCITDRSEAALVEKLHYSPPMPQPGTERYVQEVERARRILRDEYFGFVLSITGTVTWGYGDLLVAPLIHRF